jgi:hypothetical protein
MAIANARHWPEAEGDDEDQRKDDRGNRAGELQEPTNDEAQQPRRGSIFGCQEIQCEGKHRSDQRSDIADQQCLAEQFQPLAPAPEPFPDIGPDPRAVVQFEDAIEIADEVAEMGEEGAQVHFRAYSGKSERDEE